MATDGGNQTSSVELAVTITNVKNQPPHWEKDSYSVVIAENTVRDTPVVVSQSLRYIYSMYKASSLCWPKQYENRSLWFDLFIIIIYK